MTDSLDQISHHLITNKSGLDWFGNKIAKSKVQSLQMKFSKRKVWTFRNGNHAPRDPASGG